MVFCRASSWFLCINNETMIKRSFITHVLVNACFSKRLFYASYLTYVIRCRTLNMHYSIYMFTLRLTCVKYAFWKRTFNTCCTFFYVIKIMLPYDMVPQCKKLMRRIDVAHGIGAICRILRSSLYFWRLYLALVVL